MSYQIKDAEYVMNHKSWRIGVFKVGQFDEYMVYGGRGPVFSNLKSAVDYIEAALEHGSIGGRS